MCRVYICIENVTLMSYHSNREVNPVPSGIQPANYVCCLAVRWALNQHHNSQKTAKILLFQQVALSSRNQSLIVVPSNFQVAPYRTRPRYTRPASGARRRGRARRAPPPVPPPMPGPKITCRSIRNKGGTSLSTLVNQQACRLKDCMAWASLPVYIYRAEKQQNRDRKWCTPNAALHFTV